MAKKNLNINLNGRIKKVKTDNFLVALFEAVSNSIHAIEDRNLADGSISIEIIRNPRQQNFVGVNEKPITGFVVTDNGLGFDNRNMSSFEESDSTFKESKGGKGVGRFSWLKFFEKAEVSSVFKSETSWLRRDFEFSLAGLESKDPVQLKGNQSFETRISLNPLRIEFEEKSKRSAEDVAISLVEHFLAYLVTRSLPKITIFDGALSKDLESVYSESVGQNSTVTEFKIGDQTFKSTGFKNYLGSSKHTIFLCGDKRVADKCPLSAQDDFFSKRFYDGNLKAYSYHIFVESEYLDRIVNDDRDGFRFPESGSLEARDNSGVTKSEILKKLTELVHQELSDEIEKKKTENRKTVETFVTNSAPQYRYVLKSHKSEIENIHDSDPAKIDLALRKIQFEEEMKTRQELTHILRKADEKSDDSKKEWQEKSRALLSKLSEAGKANLAGYIVQRKAILELLRKRLEIDEDKFAKEEAVHELIFPMRNTSDDVSYEDQNLWIVDERLSYHYYLASDKPLSAVPLAESKSKKEPDILIFNRPIALNDRPESERTESIVIIEFKRPGESAVSGEKNPVDQILEYIELIKEGRAENRKGRKIEINSGTYFFGYVVCEIDSNLKKVLSRRTMRETPDERGMFGFFESHRAYIEVISYEKMLDDAQKRNRILFDKLQIPPRV